MNLSLPRHAELWAPGLLQSWWRDLNWKPLPGGTPTLWLLFTDHWEPFGGNVTPAVAAKRVELWQRRWPEVAARHQDDFGRHPIFTFFYPEEDYHPPTLNALAELTRAGIADVEIHLHHDNDTSASFTERLRRFLGHLIDDHSLLRLDEKGNPAWCFIHGNWALDNSRPDGRWCGLNNELTLLRELGCQVDYTLPSAPSACQTSLVNAIYWAIDDPLAPKSHDLGPLLKPGVAAPEHALLMVQGPLTLRRHPRWKVLPNLEVGELAGYALPSTARTRAWLRASPRIGNQVFLKLFGHGAQERNGPALLEKGGLDNCITLLRDECHARGWKLGFLSAWEGNRLLRGISANAALALDSTDWTELTR